jgi:hypothetical protein
MPEVYPENIGMSSENAAANHPIPAGRGRDDEMSNPWRAKCVEVRILPLAQAAGMVESPHQCHKGLVESVTGSRRNGSSKPTLILKITAATVA